MAIGTHALELEVRSKSFGFCICNGLVPWLPKDHIITTLWIYIWIPMGKM